ncbi:response regulator [Bosea sp. 124]|uniref:response regulator n=1 Tax=Bosea sp. 124 TaxID=2135642 RepID=UPI000D3B97AC|nr:response regulator [Bosea sp. 124]PTM43158.1 response regulator receiver domain-containing protein [Bosea sp. 124]
MTARILIVEDEVLVAMEMEAIIEESGFQPVGIAADSLEALKLAEDKPDVALVDLNLRDGLTGPDVGRELAKRGIVVVFVTANPRLLADGIPGALGVVEKPLDDGLIASIISFAIAKREGRDVVPPACFLPFSGDVASRQVGGRHAHG